ncbi:MAG TPA: glucosyl-3-phosphoglycerate synthase [Acidimicrobiales bacterium]|nr:glucosyl-3-phosphoglycerate synthase [Acidimicrobiales bacterium]
MTGVPTSYAWWAFDPARLADAKDELGVTVSVCLPARNEEPTVGEIVAPIRRRLVDSLGLVDELIVIDDGSTDATAAVAMAAGADVVPIETILPEEGPGTGKGNVIWRSLAASSGDLVCWVDADIRNFDLHFITGLLGPLLTDVGLHFVKGHYRRPLEGQPTGGGRVSELVARPLLSRFFPELAAFAQPLAGEYAGRRALLESLPFVEGWGVEVALLIDTFRAVGMRGLAQVDLGVREHRNRPLDELSVSAAAILSTVLERAGASPRADASAELLRFAGEAGVAGVPVPFIERPPMRTRPGYQRARALSATHRAPPAASAATGTTPAAPVPATSRPPAPLPAPAAPAAPPAGDGVDRDRIARAIVELLEAIGEDPRRDGLRRTPERVADMYAELCSGLREDPARHLDVRFDADHDELILVRDIAFASLCEHHLMPFTGRAHVGYIPGVDGRVTGLSKLARLVEGYARRPQVQERLTTQVADALEARLSPRGVVVIIEAEHLCMSMRGVSKPGAVTVTSAVRGVLRDDAAARAEAMSIVHGSRR